MDEQQRINVVGSSSNSCSKSHDIFLSFRGEDTRWNFTSHLYEALNKEKVKTYIDDQLKKGDEISPALIKAIEDSRVSIVIFSENYASSKWCLGELSKIMECREESGQVVIPVFYMVDPADVRKQSGSYERAFVKHEGDRRCKQWKADLTKAANLAGYHSKNYRNEPEFLKKIVEDLLGNLAPRHPIHLKGLVGIEESFAKIESLLKLGSSEVITFGIWGMGGIGKTTLATALYDKLSDEFEGHCFLTNVGESSHELIALREKLFSKLLGKKDCDFKLSDISRLRYKKVLIVLDDVTTSEQFKKLIIEYDFLGPGSRVIVTTRDKHILGPNDKIYSVQDLDFSHSLQLFCLTVFGEKVPKDGYEELSRRVISYCKGVPLALKVLGANLRLRSKEAWECELRKLQRIPNMEIHNVLKLSYDGLDGTQKDIFLDIACFFKQHSRGFVTSVLEAFDFYPESGIEVLLDKSLITISEYNEIEMHGLIQEMGWGIVQNESIQDIGRQSRLWNHEDVLDVLKYNKGTNVVEGIILDLSKLSGDLNVSFNSLAKMAKLRYLQIYNQRVLHYLAKVSTTDDLNGTNVEGIILDLCKISGDLNVSFDSLAKMTNLRFLEIYHEWMLRYLRIVSTTEDLNISFNKLRYLHWDGYNLESLPSNFCVEQLVVLHMCYSNLKKLWNGVQNLVNLKKITLSYSGYLIEIPDLSMAEKLEIVDLRCCTSLHKLHPSILSRPKLTYLDLSYCKSIERLNIHSKCMKALYLRYCSFLKEVSLRSEKLTIVDLFCCKVIENVNLHSRSLRTLYLGGCSVLKEISVTSEKITKVKFSSATIPALSLSIGHSFFLEVLNLTGSNIESFPTNIKNLSMLKELCLRDCRELVSLPELPPSVRVLRLHDCRKLMSLPELPPNLDTLSAFNCISLEKGISQQLLLQHMLHRYIPCVHQRLCNLWDRDYFSFPKDRVMHECGFHTAEGSITISCLPISHLSGFIYCIVLPKRFVSNDIMISMYQDHVKVRSWVGRQRFRSCDNAMSDHVMYWYDDFSQYDKILSGDITLTIEFVGREEIITEFRVFPVYATASGFKLEICESESIELEQLPTSKRRRTRPEMINFL